jgi:hypothetical protein
MAIFLISAEVMKLISDITCPAGAILTSSVELFQNAYGFNGRSSGDAGNTALNTNDRQLDRMLMGNFDIKESVEVFSSIATSTTRADDYKNLAFQKVRECLRY